MKRILLLALAAASAETRVVETVLSALTYGGGCVSRVNILNLADRMITVTVEAHHVTGALVEFESAAGNTFKLKPGESLDLQPRIEEETTGAWVAVRETVPAALRPGAAVQATTECVNAAAVRTVHREAAYPIRNPWFAADTADRGGDSLLLINTTEQPATATPCYSTGSLYAMPGKPLRLICAGSKVQIPPFGSRMFPMQQEGSTRFDLRTSGAAIVLQVLRPIAGSTHLFAVDSSVTFEGEPIRR